MSGELVTLRITIIDIQTPLRIADMNPIGIKEASAVVICYSVTDEQSRADIPKWLELVENHCKKNCVKYIVGNKIDLDPSLGGIDESLDTWYDK